jgi:1-acyl-sn-glycerol-3-phosphate acyltransferase
MIFTNQIFEDLKGLSFSYLKKEINFFQIRYYERFLFLFLAKLFFKFEYRGIENIPLKGSAIIASNHQSFLDGLLINLATSQKGRITAFLAATDYYSNFLFIHLLNQGESIPLNRKGNSSIPLQEAIFRLESGKLVGIFPEGSRTENGKIKKAHKGVALLALKTGAPVIPAAIRGAFECWNKKQKFPKPGKIVIEFSKPLYFEKRENVDEEILKKVTEKIMEKIKEVYEKLCLEK